jgi:hypothetical protein
MATGVVGTNEVRRNAKLFPMNLKAFNALGPGKIATVSRRCHGMERVMGIEPTLAAWEAAVLPLNYTRTGS